MNEENKIVSLDTVAGSLAYAMGIEPPAHAAAPAEALKAYIDESLGGKKADRVFMYNPDAVGRWIYQRHSDLLREATGCTSLQLELNTVMPSVTPVCFATMYTGAQPEIHGINKPERHVLTVDTLFDALIRAGKKPVILACNETSMSILYREREMDYFIYETIEEVNAKAAQIILEDQYDFVVVYNGNYDTAMHKAGPENVSSLAELKVNSRIFGMFSHMIKNHWKHHNTLVGFAMDHGCHYSSKGKGTHGRDLPADLEITHFYQAYPAEG